MVLKEGVTEIQDSEDEPLTSSPVRNVSPGNRQSPSSSAQLQPPLGLLDATPPAIHPAPSNGGWDDNENLFAFEEHVPNDKSLILNLCPTNQAANTNSLQQQAHISRHLTSTLAEKKSLCLQDPPFVNMSSNTKFNIAGTAHNDAGGEEHVKGAETAEYDIPLRKSTSSSGEYGGTAVEEATNYESNRSESLATGAELQPLKPSELSHEMHPIALESLEAGGIHEDVESSVTKITSLDESSSKGKVDLRSIVEDPATVQRPETTSNVTAEYATQESTVENKLTPFIEQVDLPSGHAPVFYDVVRFDAEQPKTVQDVCKEGPADSEGSSSAVKRELPREDEPNVKSLADTWSNMQPDPVLQDGNIRPAEEQHDIIANKSAQESAALHMKQKEPPEPHTSVDIDAIEDTTVSLHPTQEALDSRLERTYEGPSQSPAPPAQSSSPTKANLPAHTPQEITLAELKAQRNTLLASLAALPAVRKIIASAAYPNDDIGNGNDEEENESEPHEPTEPEIMGAANKIVKSHIKLLHEYNEIKDVGQGLMGLIADQRGVRIVEVQDEFGVGAKD